MYIFLVVFRSDPGPPCGTDSVVAICHLNTMSAIKKFVFGEKKCHTLHIGDNKGSCPELYIDTWKLEADTDDIQSLFDMIDSPGDKHMLQKLLEDLYLGDILQANGKVDQNIELRKNRGWIAINQIIMKLNELCLGKWFYEASMVLRNSLLLSTLLTNTESWYSLMPKNVSDLEQVDEALLRKIMEAPAKTPVEALYLELGATPIRYLLMMRRILYLHHILHQDPDSMLFKVLTAQIEAPVKGDWVHLVKQDILDLKLDLTIENIATMSKHQIKMASKKRRKSRGI